jgi:hypothetical protein
MVRQVFISYRHEDTAGYAGRLRDRLAQEFGRDRVFMDVDSVPLGSKFTEVIAQKVAECDVLLALIGPSWLDVRDDHGARRLDNLQDFVRIEIGAALNRKIPVIPILLNGARVPKPGQLPDDIEDLSLCIGLDIRHASFDDDIERLIRGLKRTSLKSSGWLTRRRVLTTTAAAAGVVAFGGAVYTALQTKGVPSINRPERAPSIADIAAIDAIAGIASRSEIARYQWLGRGVAPAGYVKGMALVYTRVYLKLKAGDAAAVDMARANSGDSSNDVFAYYFEEFAKAGMRNTVSGSDSLRHLFVLLTGLGMRLSSGKYCEGYLHYGSPTAKTAGAGLFQTKFNDMGASPLLGELFKYYLAHPSGFADAFNEGVQCTAQDFENVGEGEGKEFQRLSKLCPAFAVEFAAVGLRHARRFWGPINRREVEIRPECDAMLRQVQDTVDAQPAIYISLR